MKTSVYSSYLMGNADWYDKQVVDNINKIFVTKTDQKCDISILKGSQSLCGDGDLTSATVTRRVNGFEFSYDFNGDESNPNKSFLGFVSLYTDAEDTVDYYLSKKGVLDKDFKVICPGDNTKILLPSNCLKESLFRAEMVLSYEYTPQMIDCGTLANSGVIGMSQADANAAGVSSSALGGAGVSGCALANSMATSLQISVIDEIPLGIIFNRYDDKIVVLPNYI